MRARVARLSRYSPSGGRWGFGARKGGQFPQGQNVNFGDAQKRLPLSFGHSLGPDFLPSPLPSALVAAVLLLGSRFRLAACLGALQGGPLAIR